MKQLQDNQTYAENVSPSDTLSSGSVQLYLPRSLSTPPPPRDNTEKRKYNRERKAAQRKKANDKSLIAACVEEIGFYGFYKSHYIQVHINSDIFPQCTYPWGYLQEAFNLFFNTDVTRLWALFLLVVVRIYKQRQTPLPLINYTTLAFQRTARYIREDMGRC